MLFNLFFDLQKNIRLNLQLEDLKIYEIMEKIT